MARTESERMKLREERPESWIPVTKGDYISGEVVDVVSNWSDKRNSFYPILTIKVAKAPGYESGTELRVHGFSTVLFNEIDRHRPNVGEEVDIAYGGTGEAKRGLNPPELYRLTVKGRADQAKHAYGQIFSTPPAQVAQPTPPPPPEVAADEAADDIPF